VPDACFVAAVGYPGLRWKQSTTSKAQKMIDDIYQRKYRTKRFSPGKMIKGSHHDCTTLTGNSGSLIVCVQTHEAVGMHRCGISPPQTNNGCVSLGELRKALTEAQQILHNEK